MEDRTTQGGPSTPSEADVARLVRSQVETWKPRRGPDWNDLMVKIGSGPSPWVIYATASAALVFIIFAAFLIGSWLQIGALAPQPTQSHLH